MPLAVRRVPLVVVGFVSMAIGAWLGLVRLGWNLPLRWEDQLIAHGPLMVCGFLGTLISLERAVALGARWGFAAPALAAVGAVALDAGPLRTIAPPLITAGSLVMVVIFVVLYRRQASLFLATMGVAAFAWACGNVLWMAGWPIYRVVFFWLAFLVITIAGERLELNRVLRPTPLVQCAFVLTLLTVLGGVVAATRWPVPGVRILGVGLIGLSGWLVRHDVARRTVRQRGLTRFIAAGLLSGYVWLAVAGAIALIAGAAVPGVVYDALLHAVFLGFVLSMVFAHAPLIFPAILGRPLVYRPSFYLHLGVLHASVMVRVIGDLVEELGRWRSWGGLLNALALLMFMFNTGRSLALGGNRGESI
jgi:hypothetical protein